MLNLHKFLYGLSLRKKQIMNEDTYNQIVTKFQFCCFILIQDYCFYYFRKIIFVLEYYTLQAKMTISKVHYDRNIVRFLRLRINNNLRCATSSTCHNAKFIERIQAINRAEHVWISIIIKLNYIGECKHIFVIKNKYELHPLVEIQFLRENFSKI